MATRKIKMPGEVSPEVEPTAPAVEQEQPAPSALPLASDIDPFTITRSVLTQQGWICPA
jgi:hypothetical protein